MKDQLELRVGLWEDSWKSRASSQELIIIKVSNREKVQAQELFDDANLFFSFPC